MARPIHDGMTVDASEVKDLKCPACGESLGLNAEKPEEGVDHPDCQIRVGIRSATPRPASEQYVITLNKLEIPIRTFAEDKKVKQEEAKGSQKQKDAKEVQRDAKETQRDAKETQKEARNAEHQEQKANTAAAAGAKHK